jgi:hypothetical protein
MTGRSAMRFYSFSFSITSVTFLVLAPAPIIAELVRNSSFYTVSFYGEVSRSVATVLLEVQVAVLQHMPLRSLPPNDAGELNLVYVFSQFV